MIYRAQLKTRREMERDIPVDDLGWWHDVCPGQCLILRDAIQEDLDRCYLREGSSLGFKDYLSETFKGGALVLRLAVKALTPIEGEEDPF